MFEKYNTNDLFLAIINVRFPDYKKPCSLIIDGYKYLTILYKENNEYIDLQYRDHEIIEKRDSNVTCYTIEYMEPFNNYYNVKNSINSRRAKSEAKKYYKSINDNYNNKTKNCR